MYAIIKTGGKQYTVKPGDVLRVEKLDAELGAELKLDVLMIGGEKLFAGNNLGRAAVSCVVTNQQRGPKVIVFKKKRRQGYRRMGGHRQPFTELFVSSITNPEGQTVKAENKPQIFNPEKKAEKLAKSIEVREQKRAQLRASGGAKAAKADSEKPVKKAAKAKKAAPKKKTTTSAAKKKTGGSATTKKAAAKKTSKK